MMTLRPATLCSVGLLAALAGCGGSPQSSPPALPKPVAATPPAPAAPQPAAAVVPSPTLPEPSAITYDSKGRRDPFETLEVKQGAQGLTVASTRLTGIVRGVQTPIALVETADGLGYILRPGDTLGDGRVLEIGPDAVVFGVASKPGENSNRVVLRLATN
jgi:Tfp pilus assembly protein PilP